MSTSQSQRAPVCHRPELLAPAGDWQCAHAAVENGADAVYFGLDCGFNARFRAHNFGVADLPELTRYLRSRGVRGYATMNTLAFPSELPQLVGVLEKIATAGVDAILVQDFGVARIARAVCEQLEVHASTQMSLTSAETIAVAQQLGLSRVVLARELSVAEIRKIAAATEMPLEVFIHGALCVAYSGQCLTSESLGGRSANRGQCAQACRLPYELICDGEDRDLGEVRYLLSPQDLAGYAAIPDLVAAGVDSLKIEGRLKTPEYVANITSHYRRAIDEAVEHNTVTVTKHQAQEMELSFSRGFSPGWLDGNDHKRLVPGLTSAKCGIELGRIDSIHNSRLRVTLAAPIALGDGLAIRPADPVAPGSEDSWQGGRIYSIEADATAKTRRNSIKAAAAGQTVWIGFGRGEIDWTRLSPQSTLYKNDDPQLNRRLRRSYSGKQPKAQQEIDLRVEARVGSPLRLQGRLGNGTTAEVVGNDILQLATKHPASESMLQEKLGRFGGTAFQLRRFEAVIQGGPMVPASLLNQLRRELVETLDAQLAVPPSREVDEAGGRVLLDAIPAAGSHTDDTGESETACATDAPAQLVVLCRNLQQLETVAGLDVDLIYADFQDVRQYREAVQIARDHAKRIGLASIRMHKPGEGGLLKAISKHRPDVVLARNLAAIDHAVAAGLPTIADFSLNTANHRSAEWLRSLGAERVTASYDLNRDQLMDLIDATPPEWLEIVMHQHMPMFHMEHCVFCSVLSPGTNKTNCGRPCDRHVVQLRDRVGAQHTLQADIACRNTLYNATAQSGAEIVSELLRRRVNVFRIELLDEDAATVGRTISLYRGLLRGESSGTTVWRQLDAHNQLGVTRGTLEPKRNPLAIL